MEQPQMQADARLSRSPIRLGIDVEYLHPKKGLAVEIFFANRAPTCSKDRHCPQKGSLAHSAF
jgi:hypothetical protein